MDTWLGTGLGGRVDADRGEIIDAMDLRASGIGPRTWVHHLVYRRADYVLIAAGVLLFLASTVLSFMGIGRLWVPEWLMHLAAG